MQTIHTAARSLPLECLRQTICNGVFTGLTVALLFVATTFSSNGQIVSAQWSWFTPHPTGANLTDVACVNDSVVLACSDDGSVYQTTNSTQGWKKLSTPALVIHVASNNAKRCWALTEATTVLFSDDNGETWQESLNASSSGSCIAAHDESVITTGASDGVRYSTDGGITWNTFTIPGFGFAQHVVATPDAVFYAQNSSGLVVAFSELGQLIKQYPAPYKGGFQTFAVANNGTLVMGTEDKGIFTWGSEDLFWRFSTLPITKAVRALYCTTDNTMLASLATGAILTSVDNGRTFTMADTSLAPLMVLAFTETANKTRYAVGSDGLIAVNIAPNTTWQPSGSRSLHFISAIHKTVSGTFVFGDTQGNVFTRSVSSNEVHHNTITSTSSVTGITAAGNGPIIITTNASDSHNGLFLSSDDGITWSAIESSDLAGLPSFEVVKAGAPFVFYGILQGKLYRTSDAGIHWSHVPLIFDGTELSLGKHLTVVDSNVAWCTAYNDDNVYRTTNAGATWDRIQHAGFGKPYFVLASSATSICTGSTVSFNVSSDGGNTWDRSPQTATPDDIGAASPNGSFAVYSQNILYVRRSASQQWTALEIPVVDLPQRVAGEKALIWEDDETLLLSAKNGGILRAKLEIISSVVESPSQQHLLSIDGANGAGRLTQGTAQGTVSVRLHDGTGRVVSGGILHSHGGYSTLSLTGIAPAPGLYTITASQNAVVDERDNAPGIMGYLLLW